MSHETIYSTLYIQFRGALKKKSFSRILGVPARCVVRANTLKTDDHGRITDAVFISERPSAIEDRAVPGHREVDLLFSEEPSDRHCAAT